MENKDEPAFPVSGSYSDESPNVIVPLQKGMTKREYVATKMLAAAMIGYDLMDAKEKQSTIKYLMDTYGKNIKIGEALTKNAIAFADCLLNELEK